MERYLIHLAVVLLAYAGTAIGQNQPPVLPSSDALNIIKNISTPVNYYTGTAGVTIPLMQLSGKELTVPVTLSYNCSGHKVQEIAGSTGLGWSLSAGGMVTRVIRGNPDENDYFGATDEEKAPDLFFYNFCGQGGKFFFDKHKGAHTMPFRNLKISFTQTGGNIAVFEILDENGTKYVFSEQEFTDNTPDSGSKYEDKSTKSKLTSWMLTRIINANKTDSISLSYVEGSYSQKSTDLILTYDQCEKDQQHNYSSSNTFRQKLISEITSARGSIQFNYASGRKDLESTAKYLTQIDLKNLERTSIQTIRFSYSYFNSSEAEAKENYRLRLDKIIDNQSPPQYSFTYNTDVNLPNRISNAYDFWGYFNNNSSTSPYPASMFAEYFRVSSLTGNVTLKYMGSDTGEYAGGCDRSANSTYAVANILNRIDYRGGAYKIFEYEGHQAKFNDEITLAGGVRIKSITENDGTKTQKTLYDYSKNGQTSGFLYTLPKYAYIVFYSIEDRIVKSSLLIESYRCNNPLTELTDQSNVVVGYSQVEVSVADETNQQGGSIVYNYANFDKYPDEMVEGYYQDNSSKRGLLQSTIVKDANGVVLKSDTLSYDLNQPVKITQRWKENLFWGGCKRNQLEGFYRKFQFIEKPAFLTSQTSTTYRNGVSQSIQTDYEYNSLGQVSSTTQWNTNNSSEKYKTENTYIDQIIEEAKQNTTGNPCQDAYNQCVEFCERNTSAPVTCKENCDKNLTNCTNDPMREVPAILVTLDSRNQINVPIETVSSVIKNDNKTVLSAQFNLFGSEGEKVFLKESYAMNEPVTNYQGVTVTKSGFAKDSHLRRLSTTDSIDDKGNITRQTDKYGISTTYKYDTLSVPTQTTVTSNADTRTSSMTYIPLVGTTSKTDANSLSSYTDYDTLWRVKFTKDQNQDIVKRNQYHTAGESVDFEITGLGGRRCAGSSLTLSASNLIFNSNDPPAFFWDFGDGKYGQTSTTSTISHTWDNPGNYSVTATAITKKFDPIVKIEAVEILAPPNFTLTSTRNPECSYTFSANYNVPESTYTWKYRESPGPGWVTITNNNTNSFNMDTTQITRNWEYVVQLTIRNSCGESSRESEINVTDCY